MRVFMKDGIQFLKFAIVGVSNTFVSIAVYYLCLFLGFHYIIGNTIGYIAGTLNAFYWNHKYVFKQEEGKEWSGKQAFVKSFLAYGGTYLLSTGLLYIWVDIFHISTVIAPIINVLITTPLNFLLNKLWAFSTEKG